MRQETIISLVNVYTQFGILAYNRELNNEHKIQHGCCLPHWACKISKISSFPFSVSFFFSGLFPKWLKMLFSGVRD